MEPLDLKDLGEHGWSLHLECGLGRQIEELVEQHGRIPNGYFWESVAVFLVRDRAPELASEITFDSEGNAFFANAPRPEPLRTLGSWMSVVATDREALASVFADTEAAGFVLEG